MSTDTPRIQCQKEVELRIMSFGEIRCMNPQKMKTKIKITARRRTKRYIAFRENLVDESTSTDP